MPTKTNFTINPDEKSAAFKTHILERLKTAKDVSSRITLKKLRELTSAKYEEIHRQIAT